jgi:hypothetical protein
MKRSEIRDQLAILGEPVPDFAALHPGYEVQTNALSEDHLQ